MSEPLRIWTPEDYPMLQEWWTGHGWNSVPQRVLPPLGVIYKDAAAGFLYMDNGGTGVAWIEWLVTNPNEKLLLCVRALSVVVEFLKAEAKRMDYNIIMTTCRQPSLARFLQRAGFEKTDEGMIHMCGIFT